MEILAVIPARAGSKTIPNKNIRILDGKPLVYYAIQNALSSELITDVMVTTDSKEVGIIAEQMGAKVKWRDASLCGDSVTLDGVIFDAIPDGKKYDYIVTMQPTSPTLKVNTLDCAISYAIENDLDTVLSAINAPHLSWKEENGEKVPNYSKRLNRQYLPPCYMETGAFVISKSDVVKKETRIGKRVDIYEVSQEEAIDIDTFEGLRAAALILEGQKVAIYVNGNNEFGMGHIYRALEIADEFYVKPDLYYDCNQTDGKVFGNTTHQVIPVNGTKELFEKCKEKQYTLFINDILSTSLSYMEELRGVLPNAKIVNFEDDGEGISKADIVINALYHESLSPNVYAGEKYYIAGKTFLFYEPIKIKENVEKVFISFGGADYQNYADRLLEIIVKPEYRNYHFVVALGRAKKNVDALLAYDNYPNIEVLYDVENMPKIMSSCDIGMTSRGRTGYELALLGIPSISIAQNEREEKHGFVCNENGFSYLGLNPNDEVIENKLVQYLHMTKTEREALQIKMQSHDLRNGRQRVMELIRKR